MLPTRFTALVGCSLPIQQAGMGGVATPELAAAVARAGGLGMVGGVRWPAELLTQALDALDPQVRQSIGVNFLMPFLDREALAASAQRVRVIEFFYGEPDEVLVKLVHDQGALAVWQVGSAHEARKAVDAGCDFLVAQGTEAGGHVRGQIGLMALLDQVLPSVDVPVVAAGGIATARGMAAALAAGADGVRVGTRFVAAAESAAHPLYKEALLNARAEDTVLTEAFSANWAHAPHRVLRSSVEAAQAFDGPLVAETLIGGSKVAIPRLASPCPTVHTTGNVRAMALYAGESVGAVRRIQPAAEIVKELAEGAEELLRRWNET